MIYLNLLQHVPRRHPVAFRARLKGRGARGNFHWRTPMMHFMTSSLIKFVLLIRNILVWFFW